MRIHIKFKQYLPVGLLIPIVVVCYVSMIRKWDLAKDASKTKPKPRNFSIAEMMGSANVFEVVKPNERTIISEPTMPFLQANKDNITRPFAVILVTSMARYFNQRNAIRSTWYKWAEHLNIRVFFTVGFHDFSNLQLLQILEEEQRIHNDLIIDEYEEGYYKLPGKVLRMLKWYNSTYSNQNTPRFFIKTDQDVFLNLPNMVKTLKKTVYYENLIYLSKNSGFIPDAIDLLLDSSDPDSYFVGGKKFEKAKVETDPDSKWFIDSYERERLKWPTDTFPIYLNGPCYIISGNVVKTIYESSFHVPIYPFEDVYVIGMIAYARLDLYISNLDGMWLDKSSFGYFRKRKMHRRMLALHPIDHPCYMMKVCQRLANCRGNLLISSSSSSMLRNVSLSLFIMILFNL